MMGALFTNLTNPKAISGAGEKIYSSRYKTEYEQNHPGKFVAIDITSESTTPGATAGEALASARAGNRNGLFHLIRIGHPGAFEVGFAHRHVHPDRLPGQ
jgi:hypothetical protein